jgi:hypothetical protein
MLKIGEMIVAVLFLLKRFLPLLRPVGMVLLKVGSGIWKFLKSPAGYLLVWCEPILEFFLKLFTGINGPISASLQWILTTIFDKLLSFVFHVDLQSVINLIPANVSNFSCYLGLNAAIQALMSGLVTGMTVLITFEISIVVTKLKAQMFKGMLTDRWGRRR